MQQLLVLLKLKHVRLAFLRLRSLDSLQLFSEFELGLSLRQLWKSCNLLSLLLLLLCCHCCNKLLLVLEGCKLFYLQLKLVPIILLWRLSVSLLHKFQLLEDLLLDLLWVLLNPLFLAELESLPHCVLLLAF